MFNGLIKHCLFTTQVLGDIISSHIKGHCQSSLLLILNFFKELYKRYPISIIWKIIMGKWEIYTNAVSSDSWLKIPVIQYVWLWLWASRMTFSAWPFKLVHIHYLYTTPASDLFIYLWLAHFSDLHINLWLVHGPLICTWTSDLYIVL